MSEGPLLLSSAKTGILIEEPHWTERLFDVYAPVWGCALAAGFLVVGVGVWDIGSRLFATLPSDAGVIAFAPGIVAMDPPAFEVLNMSTTTPLLPARLLVPALGIDARVEHVGVGRNGAMENPSSFVTTAWYRYGARPGEEGSAVIAGHVNNALGLSGVFANLHAVPIGERIIVRGVSGEELVFVVVGKARYRADSAPLEDIFRIEGSAQLVLITCEGDWDPETRSYDSRLVVTARPAR